MLIIHLYCNIWCEIESFFGTEFKGDRAIGSLKGLSLDGPTTA
jgi:hypothetical protein